MITNDLINMLYNWEGEEGERSSQHSQVYFLIIQRLLMGLKQTNTRVLQRGFNFIMEKALWCLGEKGKCTPAVQKKPK